MSSRCWKKNKLLGSFLKAKTNSRTGKKRTRPSRVPFSVVESTSFAVSGIQDNDDMDVEDASDFHQEDDVDASSSTAEPTCPG